MSWTQLACALAFVSACSSAPAAQPPQLPDAFEARAIAADATIWGFPLVDHYRVQHAYFLDEANPEYKAPYNRVRNIARVYTPEDRAVQTPNSDTPYSMIGLDLRAEPLVITLPAVEEGRYHSVQFIDAYTFNFAYLGTRTTGNQGGRWVVAGPGWKGAIPAGTRGVVRSETAFAFAIARTQLFSPEDLTRVEEIQSGYAVEPLSTFLGQPPPPAAPALEFPAPLSPADQHASPRFFELLDFVLRQCPLNQQDAKIRGALARLGVGEGEPFDVDALPHEMQGALAQGMADAWVRLATFQKRVETGELTAADAFGTRQFLRGRWLNRMSGAVMGIYGNSREEALYPVLLADSEGRPLDGGHTYTLHFAGDALPPVDAFWSLTMYALPERLLVANPLERYLINSTMLDTLVRDGDGGLTIHVQADSPGSGRESNWLPAPDGAFFCVLRLYLPQEAAFDGTWKAPALRRIE